MPNTSRWNIGCVGSPRVGSHISHVDIMLFVSISFTLGSQHERNFRWNMGFRCKRCLESSVCLFVEYLFYILYTGKFLGMEISILSFLHPPPSSRASQELRDKEEKPWIHRLSSVVPRGLNLLD